VPEFALIARSKPAPGEKTDRGSMGLIMLVGWLAFPAAFTVAFLGSYLGTGLALANWLSALILVVMGGLTYAYRVYVEEQALASSLGQPYLDYMRNEAVHPLRVLRSVGAAFCTAFHAKHRWPQPISLLKFIKSTPRSNNASDACTRRR